MAWSRRMRVRRRSCGGDLLPERGSDQNWIARIPDAKAQLALGDGTLGFVLALGVLTLVCCGTVKPKQAR